MIDHGILLDGPDPTPEELDKWLEEMIAQEETKKTKNEEQ